MDAPRFDAWVRAFSGAASRREIIRSLSVGAVGLALVRGRPARADSAVGGAQVTTDAGVGGTADTADPSGVGGPAVCLPIARTGPEDGLTPPFFAEIIEGSCDTAAGDSIFELLDLEADEGVTAVPPAAFISRSVTTIQASIDELLDTRHSIVVRTSPDDPSLVACGEIGGIRVGDELAAGIKERNNSGYSGISLLRGANGSTLVYLFLAQGLSTLTTVPAAIGSVVVTTADVNLRAQPAGDAAVVAVIAAGTQLTVTGAAVGDWVPVEDPNTGDTGYVNAQFVEVIA